MREISIQRFIYQNLVNKRNYILIIGPDPSERFALAYSIAKNMYPNTKISDLERNHNNYNIFNNSNTFIDNCSEEDVIQLSTDYDYVILMKGISDIDLLKELWETTICKPSISSFKMFNLIYTDCTKNNDVVVINAKSETPVLSKKIYFSDYPINVDQESSPIPPVPPPPPVVIPKPTVIPTEGGVTVGGTFYKLPSKISHLNEEEEEDVVINKLDNNFCTIL